MKLAKKAVRLFALLLTCLLVWAEAAPALAAGFSTLTESQGWIAGKKKKKSQEDSSGQKGSGSSETGGLKVEEDGEYTSKEEVALYIHRYGKLPGNYITKKQAEKLGWVSREGNLWDVAPGKSIGGSYFGNYEGLLPEEDGRDYYECDIDFDGKYRGAKRIIYSNDGLVYYTEDHYKSFELLYGGPEEDAGDGKENPEDSGGQENQGKQNGLTVEEDGEYSSKEEVALYIHLYGHLPDNYITKKQAEKLGWSSKKGNLWDVAPGKSIGGSYFGNYEGALPEKRNRDYYECDIDFDGGYRGSKRIIYSNDGLVYYTEDHYKTFELLYGEE